MRPSLFTRTLLHCFASSFRRLRRAPQINLGHEAPLSLELARELEDLRKFSLSLLMMFLAIHLIAGSKVLGPLTLALLIYTISLHLAISARFLRDCPTLSRFLHTVPFLGISSMAVVELIINTKSPALAVGGLLLGALPSLIIAVYHIRWHAEMASMRLVVVTLPMLASAETTAVSNSRN